MLIITVDFMKKEISQNYNNTYYSIGEAAEKVGLSVQMIRLYEAEGLIIPFKKSSLHRLYTEEDIERIRCIRRMINEEKISITGIKRIMAMIPCWIIKKCNREISSKCDAFKNYLQPCWVTKTKIENFNKNICRNCPVYVESISCKKIKEYIRQI